MTVASAYQQKGFTAQKWFFRYGPIDGKAGLARNLAMAASVRDVVGDDYELIFDAFCGWTVSYATEMIRALEMIVPTWMEELILPERESEFRKLRVGGPYSDCDRRTRLHTLAGQGAVGQ